MLLLFLLAAHASAQGTTPVFQQGWCSSYGNCNNPLVADMYTCLNYTEAVQPNFEMPFCPEFKDRACCDEAQYRDLASRVITATSPLFGRCAACMENFRAFWCAFSCSPDQSLFNRPVSSVPGTFGPVVNHTRAIVAAEFAEGVWSSCYDVKMGSTGTTVFSLFGWDESYEAWFDYQGDPDEYAPFLIEFEYTFGSDNSSLDGVAYPCNSTEYPCACADCQIVCDLSAPAYLPPSIEDCGTAVWGTFVTCYSAIVLGACTAAALGLFGLVRLANFGRHRTSPSSMAKGSKSTLEHQFFQLGAWAASYSYLVAGAWLIFTAMMSFGIVLTEIETDPVNMWVAASSTAKQRQEKFEQLFDPFYRIEQAVISTTDGSSIVTQAHFSSVLGLQERVFALSAEYEANNVTLEQVCNRPVKGRGCLVTSPLAWFQNSRDRFDEFDGDNAVQEHVAKCAVEQASVQCRSELDFTQDPKVCLGGYDDSTRDYLNATTAVVTFLVDNVPGNEGPSAAWERQFLDLLAEGLPGLRVSYSAERSVEDEISNNNGDVPLVLASYAAMFVYVGFALGQPASWREMHKSTRFLLAAEGVLLLVSSLGIAAGLWGYLGVKPTLIHFQVIPFLILSIGLDNCFIMVDVLDATDPALPPSVRVGQVLATVGVSMTASAGSEALAFLLGALTEMPAVQSFALYTAAAVLSTYLLQISVFPAFLAWEIQRHQKTLSKKNTPSKTVADALTVDPQQGIVRNWFREVYAPALLRPTVRATVIAGCGVISLLSALAIQNLEQGLDQQLALPRDSYLQDYFEDFKLLKSGAPTFFVVDKLDWAQPQDQDKVCTLTGCNSDSLGNIVNGAQTMPEQSKYAVALGSWLDDYLLWLRFGYCCRVHSDTGEFCPPPDQCEPTALACQQCTECVAADELDEKGRPPPEIFNQFVSEFLASQCSDDCGVCGVAHQANVRQDSNGSVLAARFMTYHTTLNLQADFIDAFNSANDINDRAQKLNDLSVFPYSMFYVFFEQYATIVETALLTVGLGLAAVLALSWCLLRSPAVVGAVVLAMAMLLVDLVGVMYIWAVDLNALSVVNLTMAVGMAVEFCVHLGAAYCKGEAQTPGGGTPEARSRAALVGMGSNVVLGIALTNCSAIVLAFAESKIFEVYYFRMYIAIVILGLLHGLVFLPALLASLPISALPQPTRYGDEIWVSPKNIADDRSETVPLLRP